jgi:hypothetical protein
LLGGPSRGVKCENFSCATRGAMRRRDPLLVSSFSISHFFFFFFFAFEKKKKKKKKKFLVSDLLFCRMSSKVPESILKKKATAERLLKAKEKAAEISAKKRRATRKTIYKVKRNKNKNKKQKKQKAKSSNRSTFFSFSFLQRAESYVAEYRRAEKQAIAARRQARRAGETFCFVCVCLFYFVLFCLFVCVFVCFCVCFCLGLVWF